MRTYASLILLGLLTSSLSVASQHLTSNATVQLKAVPSTQLLAATQTSQSSGKPHRYETPRRELI